MTTVALCMVVKDEAALLPGFLERVRGAFDSLCVVDTGSSDGTLELLQAAGAKVVHREWRGDFASARNQSLALAEADWILVLDPDEHVSEGWVAAFREHVEKAELGALAVQMRNALPQGHHRLNRLVRAFRNHQGVTYRFPIHEDASESIQHALAMSGRQLATVAPVIEHLGYQREHATAKNKRARDWALLTEHLRQTPDDAYAHLKRLELARFWKDPALANEAALAAHALLDERGPGWLAGAHFGGELAVRMTEVLYPRDAALARTALQAWSREVVRSPVLCLREAELAENCLDVAEARVRYQECLALTHWMGDLQLTDTRPKLGLARMAWESGNLMEALTWVERALRTAPRDVEALTARAVLARVLEGDAGISALEGAWRGAHPQSVEVERALGEEALLAHLPERAVPHFAKARELSGDADVADRHLLAVLATGNWEKAQVAASSIRVLSPACVWGALLADLALGQDSNLEVELEPDEAEAQLLTWLRELRSVAPAAVWNFLAGKLNDLSDVFPHLSAKLAPASHGPVPR